MCITASRLISSPKVFKHNSRLSTVDLGCLRSLHARMPLILDTKVANIPFDTFNLTRDKLEHLRRVLTYAWLLSVALELRCSTSRAGKGEFAANRYRSRSSRLGSLGLLIPSNHGCHEWPGHLESGWRLSPLAEDESSMILALFRNHVAINGVKCRSNIVYLGNAMFLPRCPQIGLGKSKE